MDEIPNSFSTHTAPKASTTDEKSLQSVLGNLLKPSTPPTEMQMSDEQWWMSLAGRTIAVKYNHKQRGGWYSGFIQFAGLGDGRYTETTYTDNSSTTAAENNDSSDMEQHPEDDDNEDQIIPGVGEVRVVFDEDKKWDIIKLTMANMATSASAQIMNWMLLSPKELGATSGKDPENVRKRGRPRNQRFKPAFGPMSAGYVKHAQKNAKKSRK
jgi:hypothetical protein